jgi:hypothetical protein|nr:MAG TPA: hypothetical protein [Caudoviricetes sp.]
MGEVEDLVRVFTYKQLLNPKPYFLTVLDLGLVLSLSSYVDENTT